MEIRREEIRQDLCFVCERLFDPAEPPAETWAAGSQGEHVVHVCRECVRNPPGVPPPALDRLPEELRQPLMLHLGSLIMRSRTRQTPQSAPQSLDGELSRIRIPISRDTSPRGEPRSRVDEAGGRPETR